jgi:hypothetical protein
VLIDLFGHENPRHLTSYECFQYVLFHPDILPMQAWKNVDRAEA